MGEYAEMMLDGTCCAGCGEYLGRSDGYAIYCRSCERDGHGYAPTKKPRKERPADRGEKVRFEPAGAFHPQEQKPWLCDCGKRFLLESGARQHWRKVHTGANK